MRCAIYARFSTDRQSETSAEDQVRECRRHADQQGWTVTDVYTDLAISGATNRRPGMSGMLADAAAGAFDIVLAEALDRLARDQADIATFYQRLAFANVRIVTLSEGAVNELHIGLKGTMGALFLKDLADKIRRGQRGSLARGRIPGGLCYGYDVVREVGADGQIEAGRRRINPEQAAVVRRILEEYVAGRSPKDIARQLNREGIPSPRGGEWRASAIVGNRARMIGILHNPIYVGRYVYNRVSMKRDPETRNRVSRTNAADQHEVIKLPELRIVSDELWQQVQEHRAARANQPLTQRRRPRHIFSGLVSCARCGGGVTVIHHGRMGCTRAREAGTCAGIGTIAMAELQRRVLAGLERKLLSAEAVSLLVREYHIEREKRRREEARARRGQERRLATAAASVDRLVAAIADGGADFADLRAALAAKVEERDRLARELAEDEAPPVIALHPQIAAVYRDRVRSLIAQLRAGKSPESAAVREDLRSLIDSIVVHPPEDGQHPIEFVGSLDSALRLATGQKSRRGVPSPVLLVAEEGLEPPTRGL